MTKRGRHMNRVSFAVLATFAVILLACGLWAYTFREHSYVNPSTGQTAQGEKPQESPLLWEIFGPDSSGLLPTNYTSWGATSTRILMRFSLAAFLAGLL